VFALNNTAMIPPSQGVVYKPRKVAAESPEHFTRTALLVGINKSDLVTEMATSEM